MTVSRILKLGALAGSGLVAAAVAGLAYQGHRRPVTDSWYVALGSSYAAGLGLGPRAPGSAIVSQRSINGYPQQLSLLLKAPSFTDMTSSGSTVRHVLHGGQMMLGPQVDALGPDTRLVTLTAGGNDVGYVGDLLRLAYRNTGGLIGGTVGIFWKGPASVTGRDFTGLEANLRATLKEIAQRSPQAKIVVVTYPAVLPEHGSCPALGLTTEQAETMRHVAERLAQTTRAVAVEAGASIVDMATLSAGHDACSATPWVNGFKPQKGAAFHPTLTGARATADAIARIIGSAR